MEEPPIHQQLQHQLPHLHRHQLRHQHQGLLPLDRSKFAIPGSSRKSPQPCKDVLSVSGTYSTGPTAHRTMLMGALCVVCTTSLADAPTLAPEPIPTPLSTPLTLRHLKPSFRTESWLGTSVGNQRVGTLHPEASASQHCCLALLTAGLTSKHLNTAVMWDGNHGLLRV